MKYSNSSRQPTSRARSLAASAVADWNASMDSSLRALRFARHGTPGHAQARTLELHATDARPTWTTPLAGWNKNPARGSGIVARLLATFGEPAICGRRTAATPNFASLRARG